MAGMDLFLPLRFVFPFGSLEDFMWLSTSTFMVVTRVSQAST